MVSAYLNLGNACHRVGDFKRTVTYLQLYLKIVKDGGDRFREAIAYADLGSTHYNLKDFVTAIAYYELHLMVAKEAGITDNAAGYIYNYLGKAISIWGISKRLLFSTNRTLGLPKNWDTRLKKELHMKI